VLRWRIPGTAKRREMGLGSIRNVTLAEARSLASEKGVMIDKGMDPLAERDRLAAEARTAAAAAAHEAAMPTIAEGIEAYLNAAAADWKHVYARPNWFNPIATYAYPIIERLKINEVEPRHILAVVKNADDQGVPALGRKIRSRLKTAFDWLVAHGQRNAALGNPADSGVINAGRTAKGKSKTEHFRRIALDDAPGVFAKLYELAAGSTAIACWCFMALTACRPGEALAARWDEIDFDRRIWTNPMSKLGKPLEVPLPTAALAILEARQAARVSDLVFAGPRGSKLAHSGFASAPARAGVDAGTPHSWRSLFRDAAEDRCGFRRETCEAALGHSLGAVEGAYRRETGVEQRRVLMAAYADWLADKGAGNVVSLKRA
jgi:integrase